MRFNPPTCESSQLLFFYLETQQDAGIHITNLVKIQKCCDECGGDSTDEDVCTYESRCNACGSQCARCIKIEPTTNEFASDPCDACGNRTVTFEGENCIQRFCEWLFTKAHINVTCITHNAGGFDAQFLYIYLFENGLTPQVMFKGCKLSYMYIRDSLNIRVLDSLNFLPMFLAKLPKTFGIEQVAKGYFPHIMNTPENQNYVGPYPDPSFYGADQIKPDEREQFLKWHKTKENQQFDFREELHSYCFSDVDILRRACTKKEITGDKALDPVTREIKNTVANGLDPFEFITIASICMGIYRYAYLDEQWEVMLAEEAMAAESEGRDAVWVPGKLTDRGQLFVEVDTQWLRADDCQILDKRFVKTDIACVPDRGFGSRLKYSKASIG